MNNIFTEQRLLQLALDTERQSVSTNDKLVIAGAREGVNTTGTAFDVLLQTEIEKLVSLKKPEPGYIGQAINYVSPAPHVEGAVESDALARMYKDLHNEEKWHVLFLTDPNTIPPTTLDQAVQNADTLRSHFWKNAPATLRKELTLKYLESHLGQHKESKALIDALRIETNPAVFLDNVKDLLEIRAFMLGKDGVSPESAQAAVDILKEKAVADGKPTGYFQQKFREACDVLTDPAGGINLTEDQLRDLPTFAQNVHGTELGRMLAINGVQQWFNPLIQSYIEAKHARIVQKAESAKMLDELKNRIDTSTPNTIDRLVNGFRNLHPGVQLVTGALALWLGFKQVQRAFFPSPEQRAAGGRWGSKLVVAGGLLLLTKPMFKGTAFGEMLDAGFNAMGSAASGTADAIKGGINSLAGRGGEQDRARGLRSESDSKDIIDNQLTENLFDSLNKYGLEHGESEPLNKLRASMTLAQLPMKTIAKAFTLSPDGRGGTLNLTPELLAQIAIITGNEPQNQVLIEQVKADKAIWGNALAHMFYVASVNLSNDPTTRANNAEINAEASRLGGDYDLIPDGSKEREKYITNVQKGIAIGLGTDFTFAQLIQKLSTQNTDLEVHSNSGAFNPANYKVHEDALPNNTDILKRERILPEGIVPDPSTAPEYNLSTPRPCTRVRRCCIPRCPSGPSVDPETTPGYIHSLQEKKTQWLRTLDAMHGRRPKLGDSYAEILLDRINDNPKIKFALPPNADIRLFHDEVQFWLNRDDKLRTIRIAAYNGYFTVERDQEGGKERTLPDIDQLRKVMTIVLPIALRYAQRIGQSTYIPGDNEPPSLHYGQPLFLDNTHGSDAVAAFNRSRLDGMYGSNSVPAGGMSRRALDFNFGADYPEAYTSIEGQHDASIKVAQKSLLNELTTVYDMGAYQKLVAREDGTAIKVGTKDQVTVYFSSKSYKQTRSITTFVVNNLTGEKKEFNSTALANGYVRTLMKTDDMQACESNSTPPRLVPIVTESKEAFATLERTVGDMHNQCFEKANTLIPTVSATDTEINAFTQVVNNLPQLIERAKLAHKIGIERYGKYLTGVDLQDLQTLANSITQYGMRKTELSADEARIVHSQLQPLARTDRHQAIIKNYEDYINSK
jgi:hypothetical protein